MEDPIRLLIWGAGGRMGRSLASLLAHFPALQLVAAVSRSDHPLPADVPTFRAEAADALPAFDVAIDFSLPAAFDAVLDLCMRRGAALVSGTTGLSTGQRAELDAASSRIPVLWASNFSIGVAVLQRLLAEAAVRVADWDCEIVEAHHGRKVDAPSGTALTLAEVVAEARGEVTPPVDRNAVPGPREAGSIGIASVRGGSVIGEHTVLLFGPDERLELTHRALDRAVFARGALHAAARIAGRPAGLYRFGELV